MQQTEKVDTNEYFRVKLSQFMLKWGGNFNKNRCDKYEVGNYTLLLLIYRWMFEIKHHLTKSYHVFTSESYHITVPDL